MKRVVFLIVIIGAVMNASAQTALYKKYASQTDIKVYCVERYPLSGVDSVTVTLFVTDDTASYIAILQELHSLHGGASRIGQNEGAAKKHEDNDKKTILSFTANAIPDDKGFYMFFCPSDRLVILAFLCRNYEDQTKVTMHMIKTEF